MNAEYKIAEYKKLIECKSLGFYNCCEMFSVFLTDKTSKDTYNIFTIFVFEERIEPEITKEHLTDKLIPISNIFSMGILHSIIPMSKVDEIFKSICNAENSDFVDIGDGTLQIGNLEFVPKVFVQQDSTKEILLNKVLKNNFRNGSYILEFFDVEKRYRSLLDKKELKKLTKKLYKIIPVDLFTVSDRIGNFIFQFPSLNANVNYKTDEQELILDYNIHLDERLNKENQYQIISELMYDDNTVGFGVSSCSIPESNIKFTVGDTSHICRTTLMDNTEQLILSRRETSFMRSAHILMKVGSEFGEQRLIFNEDKTPVATIDVNSVNPIDISAPIVRLRENHIEGRQYSRRIEELVNRREFRRYGKQSEPETALIDIRKLMNLIGKGKVYLWDPYLCAEDLLDTWYYNETFGLQLYAITSKKAAEKSDLPISEWIKHEAKILETRSNNYGIRMEFRCQCNGHGYAFHDRFLMLLDEDEKPKVWSLGTSVNSLGKSHHVIQEVSHPRMIVDAFDELWEMLSADECLIWKKDN